MAEVIRECMEIVEAGKPLVLARRPLPPPAPRGFILKTTHAGVCHSDVAFLRDEQELPDGSVLRTRDVPGFEFKGVTLDLTVGQKVVVHTWIGCADCAICRSGHSNLCPKNRSGTTEFGQGGVRGCKNQGGFSTYVWVPESQYGVPVPDAIPMTTAASLPCAALTAYGALSRIKPTMDMFSKVFDRPSLVITGCGGVGLWGLNLARHALSASIKIVAVDIASIFKHETSSGKVLKGYLNLFEDCEEVQQEKLRLAKECGADETLLIPDLDTEFVDQLQRKTEGGACAVIDFVAVGRTLNAAIKSLRKGGHLHCVGLFGGQLSIFTAELISNSISLTGSRTGSLQQLRDVVKLVGENKVKGPPVEAISLQEVNRALLDLKEGRSRGRAVVVFD